MNFKKYSDEELTDLDTSSFSEKQLSLLNTEVLIRILTREAFCFNEEPEDKDE